MLLIADSGSTKADWRIIDTDGSTKASFNTIGLNPFFHEEAFIQSTLRAEKMVQQHASDIKKVFFYGAGCSSPALCLKMLNAFQPIFENAEIWVDHDLTAAAHAVSGGEPCLVGILGTGSNACKFDGQFVTQKVPALGYILGDEGSGAYFGRKILKAFLYKQLPKRIHHALIEKYDVNKETIFKNTYMQPHANVYLASFSKFLSDHRDDIWVEDFMQTGLLDFMANQICIYEEHRTWPTNFVGSIAYFFEDIVRNVAKRRAVEVGTIIKAPLDNLVQYHLNQ